MEPEELQGARQPPRDAAGRRALFEEAVSDHAAGRRRGLPLVAAERPPPLPRRHQEGRFERYIQGNFQTRLIRDSEHPLVAVRIIPMVEIIPDLKFILPAQNQLQE